MPTYESEYTSAEVESADIADTATLEDLSDGVAPASSPTPVVTGGVGFIAVRWTPIVNADPVTYEVHASTDPDFEPSEFTFAGETRGSLLFIRQLTVPSEES
jgi:hypothetical protein